MHIRILEERDNQHIESIIRTCLKEFGGDREGLAWADPQLGSLSMVYQKDHSRYWVVEYNGKIVGGCGIGPVDDMEGVCELQKMYCLPEARGTGIAHKLMVTALDFASKHYKQCYIETLSNMEAANQFYKKYDFVALERPLGNTGHFSCDVWYLKTFTDN
ncbi:GNAT family N-acetyltransferase [Paenibacillus sp. UMB4589-SE434]|uniref:GNAT family N-acetyltransferase n=1 Tax=Paenibacillus sp. UMB4589-SE434 TaxID=3046314 RepID=UPI00254EB13D|nr:GNAT family N-acetyltransferase [Paenibacillus sp. UMB4589-SE434]MDK8179980.1 GNAT family N-acetyltransferase [Paenibacillus sp. UMB4589-SE434]